MVLLKLEQQQQQMNEGSGGCGEILQQDSTMTGRDMTGKFITL